MEIEYKHTKDFTANELQRLFFPSIGNLAIILKNLSVQCTIPHKSFLHGMVIS